MVEHDGDCAACGIDLSEAEEEPWGVSDPHALYHGYNLYLGDDDRDAEWAVCEPCSRRFGERGDTYIMVYPEYPDDPPAGGVTTHRATVWQGILTDTGSRFEEGHAEIDPDGPVFGTIEAYVLESDLPAEWTRQFEGVPDDATEWVQIDAGWHSSMERSDVSDRINQITRGERGFYGPVLVKFSETNNVCSVGLTVWAAEGVDDEVRAFLRGATSTPAGAFKVR